MTHLAALPLATMLAFLALWASPISARFIIEEGGLRVVHPGQAKKQYPMAFDMALANFGAPRYGRRLRGQLIYIHPFFEQRSSCAPASCSYACQDLREADPPVDLHSQPDEAYIMLVDSGPPDPDMPCTFAEKVWNVQQSGALGAIVVHDEDSLTTMEVPENATLEYLTNITIPAVMVNRSTGDALKRLMEGGSRAIYVSMDWTNSLPRAEQVVWELWTSSGDRCGTVCDVQKQFIREFMPVAKEFDSKNWTVFTPHYIVWICPTIYRDSAECISQCIRYGRYCSPDPDGILTASYEGRDVAQENLRQLCVYQLAKEAGRPDLWWDYVTLFGEMCDMESNKYGHDCAMQVFAEINKDGWSSTAALEACVGEEDMDAAHPIMEAQLVAQQGNETEDVGEVFILPTIRINGAQYRGNLAAAEVLQAICAGFVKGSMPPECSKAT